MTDVDPFDPDRWQTLADESQATTPAAAPKKNRNRRFRRSGRFLKGSVPWAWLARALLLPGKALAVGLSLWLQRGMAGRATVLFCQTRAADEGIPITTARRAIRQLERAGLVTIRRKPGRGLEVTILDVPEAYD